MMKLESYVSLRVVKGPKTYTRHSQVSYQVTDGEPKAFGAFPVGEAEADALKWVINHLARP